MAKNDTIEIWCPQCKIKTKHGFNPRRFDYPDAPFFLCKECDHNKLTELSIQFKERDTEYLPKRKSNP